MSRILERAGVTGKWKVPGVPRKGWVCEDTRDLRDDKIICEMCETAEIRFAHYMNHPDYEETLVCGVVCAGHMSEDERGALDRETRLKSYAGKRDRWLNRHWKMSRKGNPYLNFEGFNVTVFERDGEYSYTIQRRDGYGTARFADDLFPTENTVKLAAFDQLVTLRKQD